MSRVMAEPRQYLGQWDFLCLMTVHRTPFSSKKGSAEKSGCVRGAAHLPPLRLKANHKL
jgi:hypothetical protein